MISKLAKQHELKKQLSKFHVMIKNAKKQPTVEQTKNDLETAYLELYKFEQANQDNITNYIRKAIFALYSKIDAEKVKCYPVCEKAWTDID